MPLLAAFLGSMFTSVASFVGSFFTRKVANVIAGVAVIVTLTAAFVGTINGVISGVVFVMPAWVATAASWFVPSNADECLAAWATASAARWAYDWNVKVLQLRLV